MNANIYNVTHFTEMNYWKDKEEDNPFFQIYVNNSETCFQKTTTFQSFYRNLAISCI